MQINVVMAVSRPRNWRALQRHLCQQQVHWIPLASTANADNPILKGEDVICTGDDASHKGDILYCKLNFFLNSGYLESHPGYYTVLNDDDFLDENFHHKIHNPTPSKRIVYMSMARGSGHGNRYRLRGKGVTSHPLTSLMAEPRNFRHRRAGLQQVMIHSDIFSLHRYRTDDGMADGYLIDELREHHPTEIEYRPDIYQRFNYLEPGRYL